MKLQPFPIAKIEARLDSRAKEAASQLIPIFMDYLDREVPKQTGKSASKVKARPIVRKAKGIYELSIVMPVHLYNIAKGVTFQQGGYHRARNYPFMVFPKAKWPGGDPSRNQFFRNGNYRFKRVRFHMRKNDWIGKSFTKLRRRAVYKQFTDNIFQDFRGK